MPLIPYRARTAMLTKSPRQGNDETFSNKKSTVEITAWEVWNSRVKMRTSAVSKVFNDETNVIFQTYDKLASELEGDDALKFDGYSYSVQTVRKVKSPLNLTSMLYEISVK